MHFLNILNHWPPVVYASLVWGLFWYLDRQASAQANKAISAWIRNKIVDRRDIQKIAVELFDSLYTVPLWGWRAMVRVALLSAILGVVAAYQFYPYAFIFIRNSEIRSTVLAQIATNAVADYISLFLIRRWLTVEVSVFFALLTAPVVGALVVIALYSIYDVSRFSLETWTFHFSYFVDNIIWWFGRINLPLTMRAALTLPAMAVHLWLPLFAVAVMLVRTFNLGVAATRKMQWFLKGGAQRPLRAIGFVAAAVTAIVTIAARFLLD